MIKLTASLSKKIPIAGMNYSSQSFLAGLEVELSDAAALPEVQLRIREVYQLLDASINEQIALHQPQTSQSRCDSHYPARQNERAGYRGSDQSGERRDRAAPAGRNQSFPASQAQLKAIDAITREQRLGGDDLEQLLQHHFRKCTPQELTLREASKLITLLKETVAG